MLDLFSQVLYGSNPLTGRFDVLYTNQRDLLSGLQDRGAEKQASDMARLWEHLQERARQIERANLFQCQFVDDVAKVSGYRY